MPTYWDSPEHHTGGAVMTNFWMAHPLIRSYINESISGEPQRWPLEWFASSFSSRLPFHRVLSIGSGGGDLERDLVRKRIARHVTGVDVASAIIEEARKRASAEGLSEVEYVAGDARELLRENRNRYDAIFFHGALHHFDGMRELIALVRGALVEDGTLYIDEYVGPSMHQWNVRRLFLPNLLYRLLPSLARRPRVIRAPVNPEDPSEAICSAEIVREVKRLFRVEARRDYGGNLLALVYPNLRKPHEGAALGRAEFDRVVARLIRWERRLLRFATSHHMIIVGTPRSDVSFR
jgi:SAM-dependent methyltransferase